MGSETTSLDVVLYNGSLAELNSRDPERQYSFTSEDRFVSEMYHCEDCERNFKKEVSAAGFDGLVNTRTLTHTSYSNDFGEHFITAMAVEGTPVVKASDRADGSFRK